jgi:hypothetical protein
VKFKFGDIWNSISGVITNQKQTKIPAVSSEKIGDELITQEFFIFFLVLSVENRFDLITSSYRNLNLGTFGEVLVELFVY